MALLKSFGMGKVNPAKANKVREQMVEEIEKSITKEGEKGVFSKSIETQKQLKVIEENIATIKKQTTDRIDQLELSSAGLKTQVQKELEKRLFNLENLRKVEQIKLNNRANAERLLWYLGIGLGGAFGLGQAGRVIKGIGALGMAESR